MHTPQSYRAEAENCVRRAEHAKTPNHRMTLLSMAQSWLRMADEAEVINRRLMAKSCQHPRAGVFCMLVAETTSDGALSSVLTIHGRRCSSGVVSTFERTRREHRLADAHCHSSAPNKTIVPPSSAS